MCYGYLGCGPQVSADIPVCEPIRESRSNLKRRCDACAKLFSGKGAVITIKIHVPKPSLPPFWVEAKDLPARLKD
jgi:hypothetical protein